MKKLFAVAVLVVFLAGCSDDRAARSALDAAGFSEIVIRGFGWTGCGRDDDFTTKFTAKNQNGRAVSGVVCSGWFKGGTIRFN